MNNKNRESENCPKNNTKAQNNSKNTTKPSYSVDDATPFSVFKKSCHAIDTSISSTLAICAQPGSIFRPFAMLLEWSGHGVPWFVIIICIIVKTPLVERAKLYIFYNYLFGLILDVIFVGSLKGIFKRTRPVDNHAKDQRIVISVDKYSFPSGHAARATLMVYMTLDLFPTLKTTSKILLNSWGIWVSLSRIMLGRHYVSDVLCGSFVGVALGYGLTKGLYLTDGVIYQIHSVLKEFF